MTQFLSELSAVIAARAARVRAEDRDFASTIDLAAHLFAAATYLRERYGDARMDTMPWTPADGREEALTIATVLPSDDPVLAYLGACAALVGIDAACAANRLGLAPVLPARTALQTLSDGERPALFGSVQHWIRPANPWAAARDHRAWLRPEVNIYPPTPGDQLQALGIVWDRGEALELRPVRRRDLDGHFTLPLRTTRMAIPVEIFRALAPRVLVVLSVPPEEIRKRMVRRDGDAPQAAVLADATDAEEHAARAVAEALAVPLHCWPAELSTVPALSRLIEELRA